MPCARTFISPITGESTGWICGEGIIPCSICGIVADYLCDYPLGKGKTCDAPLCRAHAIPVQPFPEITSLRVVVPCPSCDTPQQVLDLREGMSEGEWVEFCPQHYAMLKK